jgi:hypothetical protein
MADAQINHCVRFVLKSSFGQHFHVFNVNLARCPLHLDAAWQMRRLTLSELDAAR